MTAATVTISVFCEETDEMGPSSWAPPGTATGCLVDGRHVVTAAHVVACPVIPLVHVRLRDGRLLRFNVERDQGGVAVLGIASAETLDVVPPFVRHALGGEDLVAAIARPVPLPHGITDTADPSVAWGMITIKGDSGACIYGRDGSLVGVDDKSGTCSDGTLCETRIADAFTTLEGS